MELSSLNAQQQLWDRVLNNIKSQFTNANYFNLIFKDTYIYTVSEGVILVACNNAVSYAELNKYSDRIEEIIQEMSGTNFSVQFLTKNTINSSKNKKELLSSATTPVFFKDSKLEPSFTFENFVVGLSNEDAQKAALAVSENPGALYNPLFIYGDAGLGKTHLLNAIGNHLKEKSFSTRVLCVGSQNFLQEYVTFTKDSKKSEDLQTFLKNYDVLLIDDIQMLNDKKKTLEFFFDIFQYFIQNDKQIVLTSDRPPSDLEGIDNRLISRFMDGLTMQITKPDLDMVITILKKKIEFNNFNVSDFDEDAILYIAQNFQTNVRELNGAFTRVMFYNNLHPTDHFTLQAVQDILGDLASKALAPRGALTETRILSAVANYYGISSKQISGTFRNQKFVVPRHIAIYLIRDMLGTPYKKIGQLFSNRDHSTIISSIKKVEDALKTDTDYQQVVNDLKQRLKGQK